MKVKAEGNFCFLFFPLFYSSCSPFYATFGSLKVLTLGKTQINLVILSLNRTFALVIIYCTRENGFEEFFYR